MSTIIAFGIKQADGSWKNYTASVNDTTDKFGNNVSVYETQTKEEREAKVPKKYLTNGKVVWTDGKISVAAKKEAVDASSDLPF
jgi:hypothetical protein